MKSETIFRCKSLFFSNSEFNPNFLFKKATYTNQKQYILVDPFFLSDKSCACSKKLFVNISLLVFPSYV